MEKLAANTLTLGDLKSQGLKQGKSNMKKDGLNKVLTGVTTLDEVKRVIADLG